MNGRFGADDGRGQTRAGKFSRRAAGSVPATAALLLLGALLTGCGGSDKPAPTPVPLVEPTPAAPKLALSVVASPFINPDPDGRPSPMALRLYLLVDKEPFNSVAMIDLFDNDKKALGDSLAAPRQEVLIEPGGVKTLTLVLDPKAKILGVAGGFRQFRDAEWRATLALDSTKGPVRIDLGQLKVTLSVLNPDNTTSKN
jgi:type VI secretion system protein VasD